MNFLQTLLNFSERAAKIARTIRQDPRLFSLLVEEKGELEKNKRFSQDFKTLADVLIQESLRHYVAAKFPVLADYVKGEESSSFTNTLGEQIDVCVCHSQNETANLLAKVLDGNVEAATILAEVVHGHVDDVDIKENVKSKFPAIKLENIGIWIDPIDSTSEYIHGHDGVEESTSQIYQQGLPCVTVLVGVYDRSSGMPILGVVNQPFAHKDIANARWMSRIYMGVVYDNISLHTMPVPPSRESRNQPVLVISSSESSKLQSALKNQFHLVHATGAGYKALVVAVGQVEAYFCSKGSTFRWDTCAPHSILRATGGGIISYKSLLELGLTQSLKEDSLMKHQILYHEGNKEASAANQVWCNRDGVVAYRNPEILSKIYECIRSKLP